MGGILHRYYSGDRDKCQYYERWLLNQLEYHKSMRDHGGIDFISFGPRWLPDGTWYRFYSQKNKDGFNVDVLEVNAPFIQAPVKDYEMETNLFPAYDVERYDSTTGEWTIGVLVADWELNPMFFAEYTSGWVYYPTGWVWEYHSEIFDFMPTVSDSITGSVVLGDFVSSQPASTQSDFTCPACPERGPLTRHLQDSWLSTFSRKTWIDFGGEIIELPDISTRQTIDINSRFCLCIADVECPAVGYSYGINETLTSTYLEENPYGGKSILFSPGGWLFGDFYIEMETDDESSTNNTIYAHSDPGDIDGDGDTSVTIQTSLTDTFYKDDDVIELLSIDGYLRRHTISAGCNPAYHTKFMQSLSSGSVQYLWGDIYYKFNISEEDRKPAKGMEVMLLVEPLYNVIPMLSSGAPTWEYTYTSTYGDDGPSYPYDAPLTSYQTLTYSAYRVGKKATKVYELNSDPDTGYGEHWFDEDLNGSPIEPTTPVWYSDNQWLWLVRIKEEYMAKYGLRGKYIKTIGDEIKYKEVT